MRHEYFDVYLPKMLHAGSRDLRRVIREMLDKRQAVLDFTRRLNLRRQARSDSGRADYWARFVMLMSEVLGLRFSDAKKNVEFDEFAKWFDDLFRSGSTMRVKLVRESPYKSLVWFQQNRGKIFEVYSKREGGYDVDLAPVGHPGEWGFMHDHEVEELPE